MSKALMTNTAVAVNLSLNIVAKNNDGIQLFPIPLMNLTPIAFRLWKLRGQWHNSKRRKVAVICLVSILFGLGVNV